MSRQRISIPNNNNLGYVQSGVSHFPISRLPRKNRKPRALRDIPAEILATKGPLLRTQVQFENQNSTQVHENFTSIYQVPHTPVITPTPIPKDYKTPIPTDDKTPIPTDYKITQNQWEGLDKLVQHQEMTLRKLHDEINDMKQLIHVTKTQLDQKMIQEAKNSQKLQTFQQSIDTVIEGKFQKLDNTYQSKIKELHDKIVVTNQQNIDTVIEGKFQKLDNTYQSKIKELHDKIVVTNSKYQVSTQAFKNTLNMLNNNVNSKNLQPSSVYVYATTSIELKAYNNPNLEDIHDNRDLDAQKYERICILSPNDIPGWYKCARLLNNGRIVFVYYQTATTNLMDFTWSI